MSAFPQSPVIELSVFQNQQNTLFEVLRWIYQSLFV